MNTTTNSNTAAGKTIEPGESHPAHTGDFNLDVILDVSVTLSMEVGRARVPIRNLLQLNQGSVVELERAAGEPLDVYANGTLIAKGEIVSVDGRYGIQVAEVVAPARGLEGFERRA